jgi:hypothetical protein
MTKPNLKKVIDNIYTENITIKDKDVLVELDGLNDSKKNQFINFLLDVGIKMWKYSKNEIDYQKLDDHRDEFISNVEKAGKEVEEILDEYITNLLKRKDGYLAKAITRESDKLNSDISELFNIDNKTSVPGQIEGIVESTVDKLTKEFLTEIKQLNDASDVNSPLSKIKDQTIKGVTEPVNNLVGIVSDIAEVLKTNALVKIEADKGTRKGLDFEEQINNILQTYANISGDIVDEVGNKEGSSKTGKGKKKGDHVMIVSDSDGTSSRIVFETKDLSKKQSFNEVIRLLDESCQNRQAKVGIYVSSSVKSAPVNSNFARLAPNRYSVVVNKETLDTVALEVCYQISRLEALTLSRQNSSKNKIDFDTVAKSLKDLREQINLIVTVRENMSKAESDISDAKSNVNKLEDNLISGIEKIETTLNKGSNNNDKK